MATIVTLNIFSGRPNPSWILDDAAAAELHDRLSKRLDGTNALPPGSLFALGYRGIEIRREGSTEPLYVHGGVVRTTAGAPNLIDPQREIERFIIDTMPGGERGKSFGLSSKTRDVVREHIDRDLGIKLDLSRLSVIKWHETNGGCPPCVAACAPPYEATLMWNFSPTQPNNNCYNYANDRVTNTFAQPGRYHSAQYTSLTCASVQPAAVADGLVATANFTTPIADGWYLALVIWPNVDFHWYRQDKNGCWSHKPGSTPATNLDNSGNPITNPQTANRGGYTQFCSFMITKPCKVRIR